MVFGNAWKTQIHIRESSWGLSQCNRSLYSCSLHNTVYYPLSTALSLTPPTTFHSLRSVSHIPAPLHQVMPNNHYLSVCYDPYTIATLPAADSHTVAGYHTDRVGTVLAMLSIYLYPQSSEYCCTAQAIPVHWHLQMFQLKLNLHCSLKYQDVTKSVNWWNDGQLVCKDSHFRLKVTLANLITPRKCLDGGPAVCSEQIHTF
jgi:hypothetical protein